MQTAIVQAEDREQYYFYDDPVWEEDISRDDVFGVLCTEEAVGTHECVKSCLYDDMAGFIDQIQDEYKLPDGERFIVTYFQWIPSASGLLQLVDFGITKDEIIANVKAQKYVEGARYFTMAQMERQNVMDRLSAEYYMEFNGDKDAFCKAYKKNTDWLADKIQREADMQAIKAQIAAEKIVKDYESRIAELEKALECGRNGGRMRMPTTCDRPTTKGWQANPIPRT